jgi:hypothetical protein
MLVTRVRMSRHNMRVSNIERLFNGDSRSMLTVLEKALDRSHSQHIIRGVRGRLR